MARPSTMPPPWLALADAYNGVGKLADQLGISGMHLHRLSKHRDPQVREPLRRIIEQAARAKGVPNPIAATQTQALDKDTVAILDLFGASDMTAAPPEAIARIRALVTDDQLIAEIDRDEASPGCVSVNVLRAAAFLLEL